MPMKYKTQCICQMPNWEEQSKLLPSIRESHDRGYGGCNGTGEIEYPLSYGLRQSKIDGEFTDVVAWADPEDDPTDIDSYDSDIWVYFKCSCGDEISFSSYGIDVCSCGRVYQLDVILTKNDTHKGDMEYWEKIKKSKYERYSDE